MRRHLKEIIILLLQLSLFYIYPIFAAPIDPMGMVFIIIFAAFVMSLVLGCISDNKIKYLYPPVIALSFIPSVFIYYNESALVHSLWYLIISCGGLCIGTVARRILIKKIKVYHMNIEYKDIHNFTPEELERLFLSVNWSSGHFPHKLAAAMKKFSTVYSAWDKEKLVGMICAMDDGVMNAYVHYLLVDPEYHKQGIGRTLVDMIKEKYKDFLRIIVIAYNSELNFYKACGFEKSEESSPMFITSLWT